MKNIPDLIKGHEAELASLIAAHDAYQKKEQAELQVLIEQFEAKKQAFFKKGAETQLRVTHLEGMIAGYKKLLPAKKKK